MKNLETCHTDCDAFRKIIKRYSVKDENEYILRDPAEYEVERVQKALLKRIETESETKFLIIFVVAGHDLNIGGKQVVLINEFDPETEFYKHWPIEALLSNVFAE